MERYQIQIRYTDTGVLLKCPAFCITLDAGPDELDGAVAAMKSLMEQDAMARLERGEFLPADEPLTLSDQGMILYIETDFTNAFVKKSEIVRRNISLPAWIDIRLRRNNIDGSRLFQDAALAKLAELERTGRGLKRIASVTDLEDACAPDVLDEYFERRMAQVMRDGMAHGRQSC